MVKLRIDKVATAKGFSQTSLQIDARLNASVVGRYWRNQVRAVSLDVLEKLARALDCKVTDLIEEEA